MTEEIKINQDYLEAFNLGYELAKELNLQSPMFKDIKSDNKRMQAIQAGIAQYRSDDYQEKDESKIIGLNKANELQKSKDNRKGFNQSV